VISPTTTVAELVLERPARARVLERLGLDYCCGGKRSLEDACRRRGLDVATVLAVLDLDTTPGDDETDWQAAPLAELVDHIVGVHHAYLREELPRLSGLLTKVVKAHGAERPELAPVQEAFELLRAELEEHTASEEAELFPAILAGDPVVTESFEDEHARAGELLERLSELTGGYDASTVRCNTHRATLEGLQRLEADVHRHVHEENNVLFPRAAAR
jgi:regulator of cell morphogenesis and NO signaling